jgi:hypothetical protein
LPQPIDVSQSPNRRATLVSLGAAVRAPAAMSAAIWAVRLRPRLSGPVEGGSEFVLIRWWSFFQGRGRSHQDGL